MSCARSSFTRRDGAGDALVHCLGIVHSDPQQVADTVLRLVETLLDLAVADARWADGYKLAANQRCCRTHQREVLTTMGLGYLQAVPEAKGEAA